MTTQNAPTTPDTSPDTSPEAPQMMYREIGQTSISVYESGECQISTGWDGVMQSRLIKLHKHDAMALFLFFQDANVARLMWDLDRREQNAMADDLRRSDIEHELRQELRPMVLAELQQEIIDQATRTGHKQAFDMILSTLKNA